MLKKKIGRLALVLGVAFWICSCDGSNNPGIASTGGTTGASGGANGSAGAGGTTSSGGASGAGGATGASITTLADACTRNCSLASGLTGCSTTMAVCVQSCLTTFDNTSAVNAALGRQYTAMMI